MFYNLLNTPIFFLQTIFLSRDMVVSMVHHSTTNTFNYVESPLHHSCLFVPNQKFMAPSSEDYNVGQNGQMSIKMAMA
jgi:hypothetical protein